MRNANYILLPVFVCVLSFIFLYTGCHKPRNQFECTDSIGCVDIPVDEPVKIGVLQALSGEIASLGQEQIRGLELALDDRNGKILNHPVVLQIEDTGCTSEGGANAALKIIADPKHIAIFGTTCSGAAVSASKAMSEAGLTMISGNNSAAFLTSIADKKAPDWQAGYFRTAYNEENSGKAAGIYAYRELGVRKAATINDGDIYTKGLTSSFNASFSSLGGQIVLDTSVNKGEEQMNPVLTAVLNARAQLLFFPLFQPEGNNILFQVKKNPEFENITLMVGGALIDSSFLQAAGEKAKGVYFIGPASHKNTRVDQLEQKYKTKYRISPSTFYFLNAYDAASLLFDAIEKTAVTDDNGTLHMGRQALRKTLYATVNFKGVTGDLSCNEFGDCAAPVFNIFQMENLSAGLEGLKTNIKFTYSPGKQVP